MIFPARRNHDATASGSFPQDGSSSVLKPRTIHESSRRRLDRQEAHAQAPGTTSISRLKIDARSGCVTTKRKRRTAVSSRRCSCTAVTMADAHEASSRVSLGQFPRRLVLRLSRGSLVAKEACGAAV